MEKRTIMIAGSKGVFLDQESVPAMGYGMVKIQTHFSFISPGTEGNMVRNARSKDRALIKLGYVASGKIVELGKGVNEFELGDRVVAGGWPSYANHATIDVVPKNLVAKIPDGLSFERAVGCGLATVGLFATRKSRVEPGNYALIVGAGLIGQFSAQCMQIAGAKVLIADMDGFRLDIAKQSGINDVMLVDGSTCFAEATKVFTQGKGINNCILCLGGDMTVPFNAALECFSRESDNRKHGRVTLAGLGPVTLPDANQLGEIEINAVAGCGLGERDLEWAIGKRDYPLQAGQWNYNTNLSLLMDWVKSEKMKVDPLITHTYQFADAPKLWELMNDPGQKSLGIIIKYL